ncbi:MAG: poly (3-hydroxybutyrate) depolymerase [Ramlibacter sp.]|jgi:hypothetical protein|nr:poly (3-hydroxybutyrate) depolymerase [Ramlibacter sp.]
MLTVDSRVVQLGSYTVKQGQSSVSGLSSGAFMTVQLHLAYSSSFAGAGIIAGGPFRCAESFRAAALLAEDAYVQGALYICMNPLIPQTGPDAGRLAQLARDTAAAGEIDDVAHLADDHVYLFTGSADQVVYSDVVARTRRFYELLGVKPEHIFYDDSVPAGHSIITDNPEDSQLAANQPPYGNRYITTTGYNHIADSNNFIVVYPQAQGSDGGGTQNPDGCWDWWGYTSPTPNRPDYYSRDAIQVKAIHGMLERLGG